MRSVYLYTILPLSLCFSAFANPVPTDPQILIDSGGDPYSLKTQFDIVQPTGVDPLQFSFVNDSNGIVTGLTFDTTISKGLTTAEVHSGFSCPSSANQGYFLSCVIGYTQSTGALQYKFFGVNPPDGDEATDSEFGEFEGIPQGGDFTITLAGWTNGAAASDGTPLYASLPAFDNSFTAAPEPSLVWLLAVQGILLICIAGIVRHRAGRKEHSTE
jgi:hypothetical protein